MFRREQHVMTIDDVAQYFMMIEDVAQYLTMIESLISRRGRSTTCRRRSLVRGLRAGARPLILLLARRVCRVPSSEKNSQVMYAPPTFTFIVLERALQQKAHQRVDCWAPNISVDCTFAP